ncbi:hypothetical protein H4R18_004303 [Coemansia javaensis]|uniref:PAS domain-containing protein n=1 Tax=Coemansia javaensis TaxID=2761396 RepID=A0A9W8H594_9FUNG|nr:hypothetical protein H4R18_004303 [Coemansia javaensis]
MALGGPEPDGERRPTYIGIHTRDASSQILYISSGVRQALGFTPAELISVEAASLIADTNNDYMLMYEDDASSAAPVAMSEDDGADDANAYLINLNVKTGDGGSVLQRAVTFKCDNCIIVIATVFPEAPFYNRSEFEAQMLDGPKRQMNVTRERGALASPQRRRALAAARGSTFCARGRPAKAAFVLEDPAVASGEAAQSGSRIAGPLVTFVTGSVSHVVEADPDDVVGAPFMKLVAPEDLAHVGRYFDVLAASTGVQFERFALLQRPQLISGDVAVADGDNPRVVVECLGAAVDDGVVIMLRKLRTMPPLTRNSLGRYVRAKVHEIDDDDDGGGGGYLSLAEIISSDPETSDAAGWSQLC